nr:DNA repair protein RadA [Ipomoea batatas]
MIPVTSDLRPPTPSEQPTGGVRRSATQRSTPSFFSLLASTAAMACVDLRGSGEAGHLRRARSLLPSDIGVLTKQAGLKLQGIFLNVISGFKLTETAGDLAMAAANCRLAGKLLI